MKVALLVEFNIPPHPNHTAECADLVADVGQRVLRANTEPATELRVPLFTPSAPAPKNVHPFPTPSREGFKVLSSELPPPA